MKAKSLNFFEALGIETIGKVSKEYPVYRKFSKHNTMKFKQGTEKNILIQAGDSEGWYDLKHEIDICASNNVKQFQRLFNLKEHRIYIVGAFKDDEFIMIQDIFYFHKDYIFCISDTLEAEYEKRECCGLNHTYEHYFKQSDVIILDFGERDLENSASELEALYFKKQINAGKQKELIECALKTNCDVTIRDKLTKYQKRVLVDTCKMLGLNKDRILSKEIL